jgi:hypothetical protein
VSLPRFLPSAALLLVALACASNPSPLPAPAADAPAADTPPARPLAALAAERIVVLPAQRLQGAGAMGWVDRIGPAADYLSRLDNEIAFAVEQRGVRDWVFAPAIERSARRNPTVRVDPHSLSVDRLRVAEDKNDEPIPEPLGSQLRNLTVITDARYVVLPSELRFEPVAGQPAGTGRGVLVLYLIDTRASRIIRKMEITSGAVPGFSPAIAAGIAGRFADLIAAP